MRKNSRGGLKPLAIMAAEQGSEGLRHKWRFPSTPVGPPPKDQEDAEEGLPDTWLVHMRKLTPFDQDEDED